jgi:hypothetical protein
MTTNGVPEGPAVPSGARSRWLPRSRPSAVVLTVTAVGAVALLALGAFVYWFRYLACFDSCTPATPATTAVFAALAVVVAVTPFAAVRLHQGRHPALAWAAVAFLVVMAAALLTSDW